MQGNLVNNPPAPASTNMYVPVAAVLLFIMCSAA